ncbi:MAG: hypothetical protein GX892_01465 [Thermoanaerobacteraceae bacterium]|nr:hypothetical protein [Thermoanaerobacteraceae bacterium]
MSQEDENKIVEMLAIIYNVINWKKMKTSKNPHDIFNHRVRAASRRGTIFEAISKMANYFGLQSLPTEVIRIAQQLRPIEQEVLNKLYSEHIPMSMLAIMRAKEIRKERNKENETNNTEEVIEIA